MESWKKEALFVREMLKNEEEYMFSDDVFREKRRNTGFSVTYRKQFQLHFCSSVRRKNRQNSHEFTRNSHEEKAI